ncbi:MAG: hypothetical protein WC829_00740 [Hyphomicrobium sp.]
MLRDSTMLIAIVGSDGAGKSTAAAALTAELRQRGTHATVLDRWDILNNPGHYPTATFLRAQSGEIREGLIEMRQVPRFLFLMWTISLAVTRAESHRSHVFVMDGYWMKHAASEIAYGLDATWTENVVAGLRRPDRVFYLRLDPDLAWSRKQRGQVVPYECGMDATCSYGSFLSHQRKITAQLDLWSARDNWTTLDAARTSPEVTADLLDRL